MVKDKPSDRNKSTGLDHPTLKNMNTVGLLKKILFPVCFYLIALLLIQFINLTAQSYFFLAIIIYILPAPFIIIYFLANLFTTIADDISNVIPTAIHFIAGLIYIFMVL